MSVVLVVLMEMLLDDDDNSGRTSIYLYKVNSIDRELQPGVCCLFLVRASTGIASGDLLFGELQAVPQPYQGGALPLRLN